MPGRAAPGRSRRTKEPELAAPTEPVASLFEDPPADTADGPGADQAETETVARPSRPWESRTSQLQWAALSVPVLITAFEGWTRRWSTEDAFITFRVVDQLLSGNGPNFNGGERVEAATSPLWMYLLSFFKGIFGFIPLPWIAVVGGLLLTLAAVVLAMRGAARLERARGHGGFLVPVGVMVFCCVQPAWDFTTSGLETGLVFAWLAASFYGLAKRIAPIGEERPLATKPWWVPFVIGLGPLVRPDLAVATVIFLAAYLFTSRRQLRSLIEGAGIALAVPVLYQIFRMGYYAATVPNTAIAKEAGLTQWDRGLKYVFDFVSPYLLVVPALVIVLLYVVRSRLLASLLGRDDAAADEPSDDDRAAARARTDRVVVTVAPLLAGFLLAVFVAKVGGDFMHARLVLPAFFCVLLPVGVISFERARNPIVQGVLLALLGVWCIAGLLWLGPDYDSRHYARGVPPPVGPNGFQQPLFDTNTGISDERAFWETFAGRQNPVSLEDYQNSAAYKDGELHRVRSEEGLSYLWTTRFDRQRTLIVEPRIGVVTSLGNIGVFGYVAGNDVWVEDWAGLSDPIGSRINLVQTPEGEYVRGRPGHEKFMPEYYTVARWTQPNADEPLDLQNARYLLSCPDVAELLQATNDPMTPGRFFSNLVKAPKFSAMRLPIDPALGIPDHCNNG